jgi:hypothetical protein
MSFVDHPDVFIGSTGDAHTFVILNRPLPGAERQLTDAGFTAHDAGGRTVHLLPPTTALAVNEQLASATHEFLAHTLNIVNLAWTAFWDPQGPMTEPDLRFAFTHGTVTATATTATAHSLLKQHDFVPRADGLSYRAPQWPRSELGLLRVVVRAESHAYAHGLDVHVDLGIPTPDAIPAALQRTSATVPGGPVTGPARRRTH